MSRERKINWEQHFQDAQDTLDAYRRGEIDENTTLVTANGTASGLDLETEEWMTVKDRTQMKVIDFPGNL